MQGIIQVPIQRNTAEENEAIKEDKIPEGWEEWCKCMRRKIQMQDGRGKIIKT